jgi:rhodanese-related sulfurtransferase
MWLIQHGYKNVVNIRGGIDAYARKVDKSVGMY